MTSQAHGTAAAEPRAAARAAREVTDMGQMFRLCTECGADRLFEQYHDLPGSCPDAADGDCPEWSCTGCGSALLAGFALYQAEPDILPGIRGRVA